MKKYARNIMALLLCAAVAFAAAACGGKGGDAPAEPAGSSGASGASAPTDAGSPAKDTLNIAVSLDSGTLDPIGITGAGGFLAVATTYTEPVLDTTAEGERVWILATGIDTVSEIEYTLHIREGVTFSNGNPLTADDVLFTFQMYHDEPLRAMNVQSIDFDKTSVTDDYTIDLWYTQFNAAQENMLSQVLIVDKESYDPQAMSLDPVGTGPYVVTDYVVNSHVTLKARDDYWGKPAGIKNINFKVLNEESQVVNALETGEVDLSRIPPKDAEYIESLDIYNVAQSTTGYAIALFYNMSKGAATESKEARYAIDHAIDSQSIADICYGGYATPVKWPVSESLIDYEDRFANLHDTYTVGYDLDKAKALAEESGLVGKKLRLVTNGAEQYITMAEIIQNDLKQIGVEIEINNYDQATYYSILMDPTKFDLALYATSAPTVMASDIFAAFLTFFTLGWEGADYENYLKLGSDALATFDEKERSDKLMEVVGIFLDYSPWYGICDTQTLTALDKDLTGLQFYLTGDIKYQDLSFA